MDHPLSSLSAPFLYRSAPPITVGKGWVDPGNQSLKAQKSALRQQFYHARRVIPADLKDTTRWKIINNLRAILASTTPTVVALYYPQGTEINLLSLAEELWNSGHTVVLPRVSYRNHPLTFNIWLPHSLLEPDALGIPAATGSEIIPGIIILPMLGYNKRGYRLGAGGGYYDRTLKEISIPVTTIGVCYTELEITDFPAEYADVRLDTIVTGKEIIHCI